MKTEDDFRAYEALKRSKEISDANNERTAAKRHRDRVERELADIRHLLEDIRRGR